MSFEPVTMYVLRCDGETTTGQCRETLHVPDEEDWDQKTQALFYKPELPENWVRHTLPALGWQVGHRVLCPDHVKALEYMAAAELDGLPFGEVQR